MIAPLVCLLIVAAVCAIKAVRAVLLLHSALWLAAVSITTTLMLYLVEAYTIAVIELSLSVGLITILLAFAISMVGADSPDAIAPARLNLSLLGAVLLLVIGLSVPHISTQPDTGAAASASFSEVFWQQRESDVLAQIAMIFAGALGVLGLLTEVERMRSKRDQEAAHEQIAVSPYPEPEAELEQV